MKLFRLFIIVLTGSLLTTSCGEEFLEKYPLDQLTENNFYVTAEDATLAINAAYSSLQQPGMYRQNAFRWGAKTDEMFRASDWYNYTYSPSDPNTGSNTGWAPAFQGILSTNIIVQKVPGMAIDDKLKKRVLGEAAFLRGLYYYHLVRWYGDVPIILDVPTSTTNFSVPRNPAEKVYEQIIKDWTLAIENLPKKAEYARADLGRATKGAAQTMLADLYLYRAAEGLKRDHYQKVLDLTQEVIASNEYRLETNFADIFLLANENGRESIFEVQFQKGNLGTGSNANTWITTYNSTSVQPAFFTNWDATDKRRSVSIIAPGETQGDWRNNTPNYHQRKLIVGVENANGEAGNTNDSPKNFVVQRYANVLLMNAEAQNELNATPPAAAIAQVNQIRTRAGLTPLPATITKEAFRQAIRDERRLELAFEGHRWFDLVRYERMGLGGGAVAVLGTNSSPYFNTNFRWPKHALQPIPQTEIDNNPALTQNSDY